MQMKSLEAREILRNLGPDCDPELFAELQALAGGRSADAVRNSDVQTTARRLPRNMPTELHPDNVQTGRTVYDSVPAHKEAPNPGKLEDGSPAPLTLDEANRYVKLLKLEDVPGATQEQLDEINRKRIWTQDEVDIVNMQRRTAWASYNIGRQQRGFSDVMTTQKPSGYGVERVAVGSKNRVGDECKRIDDQGFSIYQCREGHGYRGDNPAMAGCPTCFQTGGGGGGGESEDTGSSSANSGGNYERF